MEGIRPCPYCGREVEVIRLPDIKEGKKRKKTYRIECRKCYALVASGTGFPDEPAWAANERIRQYEEIMRTKYPSTLDKIRF